MSQIRLLQPTLAKKTTVKSDNNKECPRVDFLSVLPWVSGVFMNQQGRVRHFLDKQTRQLSSAPRRQLPDICFHILHVCTYRICIDTALIAYISQS